MLLIAYVIGGSGITTVAAAWLSRKAARRDERQSPASPPLPVPVETPWLIQHIIEINLEVKGIKQASDTLTKAVGDLSIQVGHLSALVKRRERRRSPGKDAAVSDTRTERIA